MQQNQCPRREQAKCNNRGAQTCRTDVKIQGNFKCIFSSREPLRCLFGFLDNLSSSVLPVPPILLLLLLLLLLIIINNNNNNEESFMMVNRP